MKTVAPPPPQGSGPLGPIQVIPPGLTSLLQIKQLGRLPSRLADVVAPTIDLREWYLAARRLDEFGLSPFNTILQRTGLLTGAQGVGALHIGGTANPATVPQGQIWWVEEFCLIAPIPTAADSISLACAIANSQNTSFQILGQTGVDTVNARGRFQYARADRGFWAYSGDTFAFGITDIVSAGGITIQGCIRATPMQQ